MPGKLNNDKSRSNPGTPPKPSIPPSPIAPAPTKGMGDVVAHGKFYNALMEQLKDESVKTCGVFNLDPVDPSTKSKLDEIPVWVAAGERVTGYLDNLGLTQPQPFPEGKINPFLGVSELLRGRFSHEPVNTRRVESALEDIKRCHVKTLMQSGALLKDFLPMDLNFGEAHVIAEHLLDEERESKFSPPFGQPAAGDYKLFDSGLPPLTTCALNDTPEPLMPVTRCSPLKPLDDETPPSPRLVPQESEFDDFIVTQKAIDDEDWEQMDKQISKIIRAANATPVPRHLIQGPPAAERRQDRTSRDSIGGTQQRQAQGVQALPQTGPRRRLQTQTVVPQAQVAVTPPLESGDPPPAGASQQLPGSRRKAGAQSLRVHGKGRRRRQVQTAFPQAAVPQNGQAIPVHVGNPYSAPLPYSSVYPRMSYVFQPAMYGGYQYPWPYGMQPVARGMMAVPNYYYAQPYAVPTYGTATSTSPVSVPRGTSG